MHLRNSYIHCDLKATDVTLSGSFHINYLHTLLQLQVAELYKPHRASLKKEKK